MRYACLGQAEIASSGDNKTAVYALMDKIAFDRERYRLGHTLVFFRAGALANLQEDPWKGVRQEERPEGADQGLPEELQKVPGHERLGMVRHHPEDQRPHRSAQSRGRA